jgi:DNA primase
MEISDIKAKLSITTVLSSYSLKPDKHNKICCPFHQEKTPSFTIYPKTNTFHCFGCGISGDVIELIQLKENLGKHEAIMKAESFIEPLPKVKDPVIKPKPEKPEPPEEPQTPEERTDILTKIFESFKNGLNHPVSVKPKEYLQNRKLDYTALEMGYNSGQFHHRGKLSEADHKACIKAGLLIPYTGSLPYGNGINYTPFANNCIIFPLRNKLNQIISLYGRSIQENINGTGKHFYLKDRSGLYPHYPNPNTTKLILTEAIIDAATLLQIPEISNHYGILSCYGTNGLTEEHRAAIKELQRLDEIIFFFDGDKAGNEGIKHNATILQELGVKLSYVETPENEDINSLLQGHEPEIFTYLLEGRKEFSFLNEPILSDDKQGNETQVQQEPARTTGKLNIRNPEFITFTSDNLQIILLGGINLQQLDRLRITIKISRTDSGDPLHSIRHTLDLYHSDYLEKFINKASEQLETGTNILKRAIAELTEQIEAYRLSKIESLKEQKPQTRQLTEERKNRAIRYLKAANLLQRTNDDIGKTGVIGEEINRLLMYLVFTSRLREQPLHIVSLGASGTGKTYLQEKVSELIPEQDKLEITILSENAFYYFDRKELKHKLVLIEDMDGAQDVLYPLRELQTKRKISKTLPIKDSKGNLRTITLHVEGPICLVGTTTRERLYEDNANRSLLIYIDNSQEHKELIMEYQRKLSAGKIDSKTETMLKEFFKDMQTVLKPIKVRNPYAEYLKLPEYVFKPLRTNTHYLATIETITFYHQYQRELKTDINTGEPYIETSLEDIEWANKLLKDVLLAKSDELTNAERSFFESLKNWLKTNHRTSFYAKEIRDMFRMHPSKVKRYLYGLTTYNMIKITGGNRFKTGFEYEVTNPDDYNKLESSVTTVLDNVLNGLKEKISGSGGLPVVHGQNRPLNHKENNKLKPVVQ